MYIFFACPLFANGQQIADALEKTYMPNIYWFNLRYDHYLKSGSFLFLENNTRLSHSFNTVTRFYFLAGYEHKASERWYLGLSEKLVVIPGNTAYSSMSYQYMYTRANISHRGHIGKLKFIKELALEHLHDMTKYNNPNLVIENKGRISFAPSLVKEISVKGKPLFLIFHYRAFILFDFNNDQRSAYGERFFDKTRLRLELDYKISPRLLLSVFAIRDTDYYYRQYGDEARINRITPTYGLGINILTNAPQDFLPGFPIK